VVNLQGGGKERGEERGVIRELEKGKHRVFPPVFNLESKEGDRRAQE